MCSAWSAARLTPCDAAGGLLGRRVRSCCRTPFAALGSPSSAFVGFQWFSLRLQPASRGSARDVPQPTMQLLCRRCCSRHMAAVDAAGRVGLLRLQVWCASMCRRLSAMCLAIWRRGTYWLRQAAKLARVLWQSFGAKLMDGGCPRDGVVMCTCLQARPQLM